MQLTPAQIVAWLQNEFGNADWSNQSVVDAYNSRLDELAAASGTSADELSYIRGALGQQGFGVFTGGNTGSTTSTGTNSLEDALTGAFGGGGNPIYIDGSGYNWNRPPATTTTNTDTNTNTNTNTNTDVFNVTETETSTESEPDYEVTGQTYNHYNGRWSNLGISDQLLVALGGPDAVDNMPLQEIMYHKDLFGSIWDEIESAGGSINEEVKEATGLNIEQIVTDYWDLVTEEARGGSQGGGAVYHEATDGGHIDEFGEDVTDYLARLATPPDQPANGIDPRLLENLYGEGGLMDISNRAFWQGMLTPPETSDYSRLGVEGLISAAGQPTSPLLQEGTDWTRFALHQPLDQSGYEPLDQLLRSGLFNEINTNNPFIGNVGQALNQDGINTNNPLAPIMAGRLRGSFDRNNPYANQLDQMLGMQFDPNNPYAQDLLNIQNRIESSRGKQSPWRGTIQGEYRDSKGIQATSPTINQNLENAMARDVVGGDPYAGEIQNYLSEDYISNNPYLEKALQDASDRALLDARKNAATQFTAAGRGGSEAEQGVIGREFADRYGEYATQALADNFQRDKQNELTFRQQQQGLIGQGIQSALGNQGDRLQQEQIRANLINQQADLFNRGVQNQIGLGGLRRDLIGMGIDDFRAGAGADADLLRLQADLTGQGMQDYRTGGQQGIAWQQVMNDLLGRGLSDYRTGGDQYLRHQDQINNLLNIGMSDHRQGIGQQIQDKQLYNDLLSLGVNAGNQNVQNTLEQHRLAQELLRMGYDSESQKFDDMMRYRGQQLDILGSLYPQYVGMYNAENVRAPELVLQAGGYADNFNQLDQYRQLNALKNWQGLMGPPHQIGSGTTQRDPNAWQNALGGALAGAGTGYQVSGGNPWGAAIGAIGGGLFGYHST